MSRTDPLLQKAKAKETNVVVEPPTAPKNPANDGKPAPEDVSGNAHPPVIIVEGAEGAQALQPVAGITPHGNCFQAFNTHLDNLIDPNAASNLFFGLKNTKSCLICKKGLVLLKIYVGDKMRPLKVIQFYIKPF